MFVRVSWRHTACVALVVLAGSVARAEVKPHALFTEGAVLQQGKPVPVWGTASDGETVTVKFAGQDVSGKVENGRWKVELKPMDACAEGETLTISCGDQTVEVKDVLVGEVWLCSGQSNMQWTIQNSLDPEGVLASDAANDQKLRLFTVPRKAEDEPQTDVDASWQKPSPETVQGFSAVAFHFGAALRKAIDVPVGLISTNVGGTPAEAWTSREALEAQEELKYLIDRRNPERPTQNAYGLYNAMIAPLVPYAVQGAIWYQGESNASRYMEYRTLFPTMITNWREVFGQGDFPFLFVQLAPFGPPAEDDWGGLREAQLLTLTRVPNTGMAVITDLGDETNIHPKNKQPVGERLALAARKLAYGEDIVFSGPIFKAMTVNNRGRAVLTFDHVGGGLKAEGDALTGFTVAGEDGEFVPARARIRDDNRVVVWSPEVTEPKAVRYGWDSFPVVNLFNAEGLPASPFRTDVPE